MLRITQLVGFMAGTEGCRATASLVAAQGNAASANPYTFNNISFGAAHPDRQLVVIAVIKSTELGTTATVDGDAMDLLVQEQRDSGGEDLAISAFSLNVPTGTVGTIVITPSSGGSSSCYIAVFRVISNVDNLPFDTASFNASSGTSGALTLDTRDGGLVIFSAAVRDETEISWDVGTELYQSNIDVGACGGILNPTDGSPVTITASWSGSSINMGIALAWGCFTTATDPYIAYVTFLSGFEGTDGSTSFTDESASANSITAAGDAQVDTAQAKYGTSSLLVDGTGDYLEVGVTNDTDFETPNTTTPFTIEAWVRFNSIAGDHAIFGAWDPPVGGYLFRYYAGNIEWFNYNGTNCTGNAWSISTGVWYHVAVDFDGTKLRIFGDGVMLGSVTAGQQLSMLFGRKFTIGAQGGDGRNFNGWIDEFRFTDGISRYGSDSSFTPPTTAFPRS